MESTPRLIAFYSPAPQSGKTTASRYLAEKLSPGPVVLPFAGPLKRLAFEFLCQCGLTSIQARRYIFGAKEEVIPELGVTGRHILQTLGTDWGRDLIKNSVWVDSWSSMALRFLQDPKQSVLVDDMRFPNEHAEVKRLGGFTVHMSRDKVYTDEPHPSEGQLEGFAFDAFVVNDGTIQDLTDKLDSLFACVA